MSLPRNPLTPPAEETARMDQEIEARAAGERALKREAINQAIDARTKHILALRKARRDLANAVEELCTVHALHQFNNGRERNGERLDRCATHLRACLQVYQSFEENA